METLKDLRIVFFVIWCLSYWITIRLEFGTVFLLFSVIFAIFKSLGSHKPGEPSAYSVFNSGGQKLVGTFNNISPHDVLTSNTGKIDNIYKPLADVNNKKPGFNQQQMKGKKIPRNAKCPCGSEKKYSKCCGAAHLKNINYDDLVDRFEKDDDLL